MTEQKQYLGIDQILPVNADDTEYDEVQTKQGLVRIGSLSADEVVQWLSSPTETAEQRSVRTATLIQRSLVDGAGKRIATPEHIPAIRRKTNAWTEAVLRKIVALNALEVRPRELALKKD